MFNRSKKKSPSSQEGSDDKKKWQPSTNKVLRAMNPSLLMSHFKKNKGNTKDTETVEINSKVGVGSAKKK